MIPIPEEFIKEMQLLFGEEAEKLISALNEAPVTSVRVNKRKPMAQFPDSDPVKWCSSGWYLKERPEFILDPLLHAGAYYVQDASSMIYEPLVHLLSEKLNASHTSRNNYNLQVLDLCASPGGKTTAMINGLSDGTHITANEYTKKRVGALQENIERWGYPDVTVTNKDSKFYGVQGENFDIIAVDAPCSGEGMMRKEEVARSQWSPTLVAQCATLQKEILSNAVGALKPGGFLIYSTCTFNRRENEENAEYIQETLGLEPFDPGFPEDWNIPRGINTTLPVYRFLPHITKGEGLFLAVFRKPGEWSPSHKKKEIREEKPAYPLVEVNKETALAYLRRECIVLPPEAPRGLVMISYMGLPLGPAKNIGSRANNLFPKNRRILKR